MTFFKNRFKPIILTLIPTHKCTARCGDCCFRCSPDIKHIMTKDEILGHIDSSIFLFKTIKLVVFSGGECFLLGNVLNDVISYCKRKKLKTRVVTNGFWAKTYDRTYSILHDLKECGLDELNVSTGDNHLEFVPFTNIDNIIEAAIKLNIKLFIALESHDASDFKMKNFISDARLAEYLKNGKFNILSAAWMPFSLNSAANNVEYDTQNDLVSDGCVNLFNNITINPYSQMLACCGLTVEYIPYLKLGNIRENTIDGLYFRQFDDLYKIWLFLDGPKYIYKRLCNKINKIPIKYNHSCAYCMELMRIDNFKYLSDLISEEADNIIYKFGMRFIKKEFYNNLK